MQVCIHRGAKEIGGTCVELISEGKRILIDLGLPLDAAACSAKYLPDINFQAHENSPLAIIISHGHIDHCGLLNHVNNNIPIYIGGHAKNIIQAAEPFMSKDWPAIKDSVELENRNPITIDPFKITPYLVDHSGYDAYALLVEAEGRRLFYSGDFRIHGRKRSLVEQLMANPPEDIDVLLMEGTTIGRTDTAGTMKSEQELEVQFENEFRQAGGLSLVHCSSQNIDRIVSIYRACKKTGKKLVIDLYSATILEATGNSRIPQSSWDDVCLFVPQRQRVQVKNKKLFHLINRHSRHRIYKEQLSDSPSEYVLLFRPIHIPDLEEIRLNRNTRYIYSQWEGYWDGLQFAPLRKWVKSKGIEKKTIHTSGHAGTEDLIRFATALAPKQIVPIHSFHGKKYHRFFENVVL